MNTDIKQFQSVAVGVDLDTLDPKARELILVVNGGKETLQTMKIMLLRNGFNVVGAVRKNEAVQKLTRFQPDFLLLDLDTLHDDRWETYDSIKDLVDIPTILLSKNGNKEEIIKGFRRGADDYVTKPYHSQELIERIKAVLRRANYQPAISILEFPNLQLSINMQTREVIFQGHQIHLAPKEFRFLSLLAREYPAVVPYETIGEHVWTKETDKIRKRTNYMVYLLRQKLSPADNSMNLIKNVDRVGYRLMMVDG